jgi:enolase
LIFSCSWEVVMPLIRQVLAREVLDSRGNPTVEVEIGLDGGVTGRAIVPSGASTGTFEAHELRDGGSRYDGKGVQKAVLNVCEEISSQITGMDSAGQYELDARLVEMDGSEDKSRLGANAVLAVSLAAARASSKYLGLPLFRYLGGINGRVLPLPMMNILNGGEHADNDVDIQEFMILPWGAGTFHEALRMGSEVYHALHRVLKAEGLATGVGDEGGFAPDLSSNIEALEIIVRAISDAGYQPGSDVALALDVAANEIYRDGRYYLQLDDREMDAEELVDYYQDIITRFPVVSIEDGMAEEDWEGWANMTGKVGEKILLVGDDLFVTNVQRLRKGIEVGAANAILIKLNQIGTFSETLEVMRAAEEAGFARIVSHRSGETEDTTIADLAVASNCGFIKSGAPTRTDRVSKYNQLLRIEEWLGAGALFAGPGIRNRRGHGRAGTN